MSGTNKSLDKNKRFAGVKANDFVNKTRVNETNRSASRPQGWANLGKINSRRIPPPANLPSLKSETGVNSPVFDPTVTTNHNWSSNENHSSINTTPNPTQQQMDSLPVNSPTPPPSQPPPPPLHPQPLMDIDKPRIAPTWSTITSGPNPNEQIPSLLPLNDFPRLATTPDRKSQPEPIANFQNPSFRPANLATWKEGGSNRVHDMSQMIPNNPGANLYQQQMPNPNMRMYPLQMWAYNPYPPVPLPMHKQTQQSMNKMHEYKSPTILRHKDIDDLSKITDNTWANSTQEVNYEEKIRFSDDEDDNNHRRVEILESNNKARRINPQVLQHSRLIQDDEHVKQLQDNKNSELMNALNVAKQRRDEQERSLKNEQFNSNIDEQKQIPGYHTRPLLSSNDQENLNSPTLWQANKDTSRTRHDTANSQSSFAMKSWSDQMDSYNYSSSFEKTRGYTENEDSPIGNKTNRSQSGSSSPSQFNNDSSTIKKSKKVLSASKKQPKVNIILSKTSAKRSPKVDNQPKTSNEQLDNFDDSIDNSRYQQHTNENRHQQQFQSDSLSTQKSNRFNKQSSTKTRNNERQQTNSRTKQISSGKNPKTQAVWRPLSPNRQNESNDPTPQESMSYKPQQRSNLNEHKQRYQTAPPLIDTSSIPPLMSVRSDATATANLYKTATHFDSETMYYNSNVDMHQNYHHTNLHNRGYTTLGSYGRYRRGGTVRHQQQYTSYNVNNTSGISSAPNTSSGPRQKKNSSNRTNANKTTKTSDQNKTPNEDISIPKLLETPVLPSTNEVLVKDTEKLNDTAEQKPMMKNDNETNSLLQSENSSTKNTTIVTSSNSKKRTNKNQQNYNQDQHYQSQQPPRHRNNYSRPMQDYDNMQMTGTHNYYGTNHRSANNSRNTHMHELSSGYYYEHPKQHYNNRYNYSNENYQKKRPTNKNSKRGGTSAINNRQPTNGSNNNNNNNHLQHSTSDNDQKEGEEWETASESSTNMRNDSFDTNAINSEQTNETKSSNHRGRTPPKKSFSSQRPNARQILKYTNA